MSEAASGYERQDLEKYFTPAWVVDALCEVVKFSGKLWDPASGAGDIVKALDRHYPQMPIGTDIDPDNGHEGWSLPGDFFDPYIRSTHSYLRCSIITNPPYGKGGRLATRFISDSLDHTKRGKGKVAMLLRVDFDSAAGRRHLFADHPAFSRKLVLTKRIRWVNLPQSSAGPTQNHAWFIWDWSKSPTALPYIGYLPQKVAMRQRERAKQGQA